ncbi:hypothetical protein [Pseudomonas orientalis]|uniref:hypothetical protein n=1 Tax=Pseudomonas orientalis TaxID=76758 RepID=UPI000F5601B6|nr:hypothetical protein [Pseudomonas orientalis]
MLYNYRLPFSSSFTRVFMLIFALGAWNTVSYANSMVTSLPNPHAAPTAGVAPLLSATAPGSERFFAVGLMRTTRGLSWECTATLIANSETPNDDQAALILTAGHCSVDPLVAIDNGDNDVIIDKPMAVGFVFIPAYFFDNIDEHHEYAIKRIVYSSMKGSEIGLLELAATYGELRSRGVKPVLLKNFEASDRNIELVHIPQGLFPGGFFYAIRFANRNRPCLFLKVPGRFGETFPGIGRIHAPMTVSACTAVLRALRSLQKMASE